jgi:hypothetical protein
MFQRICYLIRDLLDEICGKSIKICAILVLKRFNNIKDLRVSNWGISKAQEGDVVIRGWYNRRLSIRNVINKVASSVNEKII